MWTQSVIKNHASMKEQTSSNASKLPVIILQRGASISNVAGIIQN